MAIALTSFKVDDSNKNKLSIDKSETKSVSNSASALLEVTCDLNNHGLSDNGIDERLIWMKFPSVSDTPREYSVMNNSSKLQEFADGTALLTGRVAQVGDYNNQWEYHVKLVHKRNWSQWSALGRSYKDGTNSGDHTTWSYYEVDNSDSYFIGHGDHNGEVLNISHNPSDFEFGFQVGVGANDMNSAYGLSGWFKFSGSSTGYGDFNSNLENCDLTTPVCSEFEANKSDANVGQDNGKIVVTNLDAAANYRLFLDGTQIAENQGAVFIVTDLAPGTYTLLARGFDSGFGQQCQKSFSFTINEVGANLGCTITPPVDLELTCVDDITPDFTGYPIINCDAGGSCDRDPGYYELDYQIFATSTTSDWSFGQGWQIGNGCTPSCGLAPNAFIDFTNMYYAYDRSLTSPVFDACGLDNVQIDYCIRSDLFTNNSSNAPIQYLDVQYKIGNGSWTTLNTYESENGQTNDFNEDDVNIPGAADSQLRIRFRARGAGGSFTLGGWGVDRLRVEGNSSGSLVTLNPSDYNITYNDEVSATECPQVITRTWTATPNNSAQNCTPSTLVEYDMDGCISFNNNGTNFDYSEFTPAYPNNGNCVNVNATGVYRESGMHSCIVGQGGNGKAACFGVDGLTSFHDDSDKAIRFEVTLNPSDAGRLTALKFDEWAPDHFSHISGNSGTNNYPQKYGVRVLKNGVEVFKQIDINTTQSWSLETFDFSNNPDFEILTTTIFEFELLSYDAVGNGGQISAWDLDNIRIEGCCGSGVGAEVLTAIQLITVDDEIAPDVSGIPADVTIQCDETAPIVAPIFTDLCDNNLDIVFAENILNELCDDAKTLERTWTATDDCGNIRVATQVVTIIDTTNPILQPAPDNMAAECDAIPAPANLTATDNCDNDVEVVFSETRIDGFCDNSYTLERTWIATDNCGNSVQENQTITVADQTPPTFGFLTDVTLECSDDLTPPTPVATDNCDDNVTIILNDEFRMDLSCTDNYTLTRTWTATDNCGNQSTYTQVATIVDTTPPSITAPADATASCDNVPAPATVGATDNCDNDVDVVFAEVRTDGNCPNNYTLTRTWTATDNCGNVSSDVQIVTIIDNAGPVILDAPASVTVECDNYTDAPTVSIQDNCDANATIALQEIITAGTCDDSYIVTRTWTATDACGNATTAIQVVTVTDTQSPVLAGIPAATTVECDAIPAPANPTADDNCDDNVTIQLQEVSTQTNDGSCTDNSYTLTRIWTATDNCGNVDVQQQVITVVDTTDPTLGNLPASTTVQCDNIPDPATLTSSDNCDDDAAITFNETSTKTNNGSCTDDTYVITRTWTATDNCGNTDSYSQTINVEDTTDPVLAGIPSNITVTTLPVPAPAIPTATDNCDGDVTITFEEVSGEGCNYEIVRTWTATDNCGNEDVQTQTITVTIDPQAGTLNIDDTLVCLAPTGSGVISATPNGDANVPAGFDVIYVLTKGTGLVIEQVNATPSFTALTSGKYTIHTLLYVSNPADHNYLDLSIVDFGTTTGFDVNALLQQGGGLLCGSLDVAGAMVEVDNCDAKIGNFVFEDKNGNGVQDAGEPGIENAIVNLNGMTLDGEDVFLSTQTDAFGQYIFENLAPGNYRLTFVQPIGFQSTIANQGDDTLDSDPDAITGMTVIENLESGEENLTYDAGFYKVGKIGNFVFEDLNGNGIQDAGEPGVENVTVTLTGTTGDGILVNTSVTTGPDGLYLFEDLAPGTYKLTFDGSADFVRTYTDEGGDDALDSDASQDMGMSELVVLESGETNETIDAGFYKPAKIGNFVFDDKNANGIQDAGEPGLPNVQVVLNGTTGNGTAVNLFATTDGNGFYTFENLIPGDYKLTFVTPLDYKTTYPNEGGDDALDSDVDPLSGMTVFENLESGEDNDTYDAGFFKAGKIGDMVFQDLNGNGIMDFGDTGIENVQVQLTGETGNGTDITLFATTDADGKYIFDDLAPGTYKLTFTTPTGFVTTYLDQGGNDNSDSDVDPATGMTEFVTIESGEENKTLDAGYYQPAKIGDMVFVDKNANGIMEAGEAGIQFVAVELSGFTGNNTPITLTTETDENGKYSFDNLVPGAYKLTFTADPIYQATLQNFGDDEFDSDIDPTTGMTSFELLTSGETNLTYDAGYYVFGKIGNFVFEDLNGNGIQDAGEPGVENVTVTLTGTTGDGILVNTAVTTGPDGQYLFEDLAPGTYKLTFDGPADFVRTYTDEGGDDALDSDASQDMGMSEFIVLESGETNDSIDAGFYKPAKIGNFVFEDKNANGIQDAGEPGIANVQVELTGETGNGTDVTLSVPTDGNGFYSFENLIPGDYKLTFTTPLDYKTTYPNEGGDDALDSDVDPLTGMTVFENLESGEDNDTYDAGFFKAGKIGNFVFEDLNGNGIQDAGEPGVENVVVSLTGETGNGTVVYVTFTTGPDGQYIFEDLAPGTYKLTFDAPAGFIATYGDEGADDTKDSDVDPTMGMTEFVVLESGETNETLDAGFYKPAKIGNFVFEDKNANGIQDAGEPGIANVQVELTGETGNGTDVTLSTTTDGNGFYIFENLVPGDYKLTFTTPLDYKTTYPNEGGDDALDSDVDPLSGMTAFENLESGEDNDTYDAGFFKSGKIGDMVFEDKNGNGIMDFGEGGIANVQVQLTGETGNGTDITLFATTDADGKYIFEDLAPGTYKLTFTTPAGMEITYLNEGGNDNSDSDVDPATGMTEFITIESGEENKTLDAGYYTPAKIGNFAFEDKNANGIQDAGEPGIANVQVELTGTTGNGTAITLPATTDGNGFYTFENLVPGDYKLTFTTPLDYKTTYPNEGGDDALDSDVDPLSGMTAFENLESGEDNDTYDAGFFKSGKIGDMVFEDKNGNGIMDFGEGGIENVQVQLTGETGNGTDITLFATTDADGKYIFDDLAPGTYKLTFTTPTGMEITYLNEGGNDNSDSDIDPDTGMTEFVTIASGEENKTLDAGYYTPAKIGDMAFLDTNANGIMEAGEAGIEFVTVELSGFTGNNTPITKTTQTDDNGKYIFDNLVPGAYKLTFTADPLYQATKQDFGDDTTDSDIDPLTGMTAIEVLTSGETNLTYDAGYFVFGKIGDFVWLDCNKDGMQSPGEEGFPNVTLRLFGTNGAGLPVQKVTTTDADGKYEFDELMPGVYLITMDLPTLPTGLTFTLANQGDDAFDSDFEGGATGDISITSGLIITDVDGGLMDIEGPTFAGLPAITLTVECDAIPDPANPTATDNIDTDVDIAFVETTTQSGNTSACLNNAYTITRTWTATDDCGNETVYTQTITVQDTTNPELFGVPANVTVECDAVPAPAQPTATDNCDVDPAISFVENKIDGDCTDKYILERTWTATDNCGNEFSQTQYITVVDTTDPELFAVPDDVTISCDFIPAPAVPYATDNCDNDVDIDFDEVRIDGTCPQSYTLIRTWTAIDNCGNATAKTQTITVQDLVDPSIYDIPADVTVECDNVPGISTAPFATDNCDDDVDITFAQVKVDGDCTDNYKLERTWTATDDCGNSVSQTQTITVQDTTDPILSGVPTNITVECDAVPFAAQPTAIDNCDTNVDIDYEEVRTDGACPDSYTLTRTWLAIDNCGNEDLQTQIITVQDTTDPTLSGVPANVTVECDAVPFAAQPTAADNCDTDVAIDYAEVRIDGDCTDSYTLERTWTATDNCGNEFSQTQIITVQDTTDPMLVGVPANVTVECNAIPDPAQPTAMDNCDTDVEIDYEEVRIDGNCADNYTLERTWLAIDNCGNEFSQTQIITVQDTTDPELVGVPASVTVECDLVPAPATPLAIDNCDADVDIDFVEVRTDGNCVDNYILTRTWTATDNCGNTDVQTQIITVQDTSDPNIYDIPADVTVECDNIPGISTAPFATDNCDTDVAITFAQVKVDGDCTDSYTLERTWTATDNCGNNVSQTQIITVQDTTDPMLSGVPANVTVECDAVPFAAQPTAADNCDTDVAIDYEEVRTDGACPDSYTLTRTWLAIDNCGNEDLQTQVITVQDTTDPTLAGVPANITVECNAVPFAAQPTAADNCDTDVAIDYAEVRIDGGCTDSYTLERTWTATDNCGNSISQTQIITVQDTTDPTLSGVPANVTVECDAVPFAAQPTAADNCDTDVEIDYEEVRIDGACTDSYTLERTWTATDNCGNEFSQTQIITVQDTTDPMLVGVPANVTVECNAIPDPAQPTAMDNCDTDVEIDYEEVRIDGNCADNYTLERTWLAIDNCGNEFSQTQIITVQDTTDPELVGVPASVTVECDLVPAPATPLAIDNCDADVDIDFVEVRTDGNCVDNYILTRTWTATDNCGNTDVKIQIITVQDTSDPNIYDIPADVTVECDNIPGISTAPFANDNCDTDVAITFAQVKVDGDCTDSYTLERTWTATDNCGNNVSQTQIITVQDTTDPILSGVPANVTVECDAVPFAAQPTAIDNCDMDVEIDYEEVRTDGACPDSYTLTRTWLAIDNCGNEDLQTQVITVQDTTDPTLSGVPANVTVECNAVPFAAQPTAADNCDTDVAIDYAEVRIDGACTDSYTLERTWTATDNCGNSISQTQIITVQDTTDPTLSGVPANVTVECDAVPFAAQPTAADNCDTDVEIDYEEVRIDGDCTDSYTLERTWLAIDNCGNEFSQTQIITVQDTTDPMLSGVPTNETVECDAIPDPAQPTAVDNCNGDVSISFVENQIDGNCTNNYVLERIWTATDNCGNEFSQTQYITVVDIKNPLLTGVPGNVTVECDAIPDPLEIYVDILATDNCDMDVEITLEESTLSGNCTDNYFIARKYTATDNCGNETVLTQLITVEDNTPPTITGVPMDLTVDCNEVPAAPAASEIIVNDNCDTDVTITFSEIIQPGQCADSYTLKRIWTATDNCSNITVATQTITVQDVTPPTLVGVPTNINVDCNSVPGTPTPGAVTAIDNCDATVFVQYNEELILGSCANSYVLKRTWTATDNCGNEATATQVITVGDTAPPTLVGVPASTTVNCDAVPAPASVTATDECDPNVLVEFEETTVVDGCATIITRTWSAEDNCGNFVEATQIITVTGDEPILTNLPDDVTVECDNIPTPANVGVDAGCIQGVQILYNAVIIPGACENSYVIERTWSSNISTGCGSGVSHTQTITVEDTQMPTLVGVPTGMTVDCGLVPAAAQVTATDNCDTNVDVSFNEVQNPLACGYELVRTWIATDNCGNTAEATQIIIVEDQTPPTLVGVPAGLTVDCNNIPTVGGNVTATDNCTVNVSIDYTETTTPGACANSYTLTRTWIATDDCGNETSASQIITVGDNTPPTVVGVPNNITVECTAVPFAPALTATDNCDTQVGVVYSQVQTPLPCGFLLTRTWTATDACGNVGTGSQEITVQDTTDPTLLNIPNNLTVECSNIPTVSQGVGLLDNCDPNPSLDFVQTITPGACDDTYLIIRTWTATDACGNSVSESQEITVEDTQLPVLLGVPSNVTVDCNNVPTAAQPTATDNCDTDVNIDFDETTTLDGCNAIITRTWTASDNCGNIVTGIQMITVESDEPVLAGTPSDMTVECSNIPTAANVTANSDCLGNIPVDFVENIIAGSCEDGYTIERTWSASLACGSAVSYTQTITVEDTQNPILAGVPSSIVVDCGSVPTPATPVASDNCDDDVDISFSEIQNPLACGYELVRTWTATDDCGNETSASQTITVEDQTPPVLVGVPASITADCNNIPTVSGNVTATDNCSFNVPVGYTETTTQGACANSYVLTRTWTAIDDCGNETSESQIITVGDNTPPTVVDVPNNITVECTAVPFAPALTATDNCDPQVNVVYSQVQTPLPCGFLLTRTWTATDACGNVGIGTQEITVQDTTDPTLLNIPNNLTVECNNIPTVSQGVGLLDNCDPNPSLDFVQTITPGACDDTYIIIRTWTATDACGNSVSESQEITVEDTQLPVLLGVPSNVTVDCNNVPAAAQPTATDNCDTDVNIDFDETTTLDGCNAIITRTWTASDNCGNIVTGVQMITVESDEPVLAGTPNDVTVQCNNIPTAANVTASSACLGNIQVDFVENIIPGSCEDGYTIERTWTAGLACGSAASYTQTITVEDTQNPILAGVPSSINVACGNIPVPATPIASDNCDDDVEISFSEIQNPLPCGYELIRTWIATDDCGNETQASQTITVQDNENPTLIGVPTNATVNCGSVPMPAEPTATDNCDTDVEISFSETSAVNGCATIITRTWTAIDDCGNEVSESQTITINPDAPTLSATPDDITVECDNIPVEADLSAFDGCSQNPIPLNFVENVIPGSCEHSYILERIWSVDNGCASISHTQLVTVQDTKEPTLIGVPINTTTDCTLIPAVPVVTATDNCDTDVEVIFTENQTPAACGYVLTRTWTATDDCGNTVAATQTIEVGDDTPPSLAGVPSNITVECNNIPTEASPVAQDNCDSDVIITYNQTTQPGACPDSYTLTRTWTATDDCGNTTDGVQVITVQDTTDPTLIGVPTNINIDLTLGQTVPSAPNVIGSDNCDTDVNIDFIENQIGNGCSYTLERTWTATDNCGNFSTATQTIIVTGGLSVTETHADASCGENNGSIDLTLSGGLAPITFDWNNGIGNIEDPSNLSPGIYEVTVSDATGCQANLSIEILGTSNIQLNVATTMVSCFGESDGSIDLTVTGGSGVLTYQWSNGIGNVEDPSGLAAGSYNVTVTDANGCSAMTGANVNQPQELLLTISPTNIGCNGGLGMATATPSGGTQPYHYLWSDGQTTATATDLAPGTYEVTITDGNDCTISLSTTIDNIPGLTVSIGNTNVACFGENNGGATANVSGGQGSLIYLWSNGHDGPTASNLEAGMYSVIVTDANGCTGESTVNIEEPNALTLSINATGGNCNNGVGMAMVIADGGTLGYTYLWNDPAAQTTATAENLAEGTYSVIVTDANGCSETASVTVSNDMGLGVMIDKTDVSCYLGTDGAASAMVMGGTPAYTYLWSNGETDAILSNLDAGSYTVTVTDATGCTGTATVEIISPPELQLTLSSTNASVNGHDGTATVTATGGTTPYSYIWNNGQSTATIDGLNAGTYSVTVIDANGCFETDDVVVNEGLPLGDVDLGDYVWFDSDRDGIQDANEIGYNNVQVNLIAAGMDGVFGTLDDEIVQTTTTGNHPTNGTAGYYLFSYVEAGQYQIEFVLSSLPNDYQFSIANQGTDDNLDSDANQGTGRTSTFTVTAGQLNDLSFDAGVHPECDNVTNGGQIMATQTICAGSTPDLLVNSVFPSGGSGAFEYIWLTNTTGSPFSNTNPEWTIIPGATDEFYQPGQLYENTFFIRCVRRAGCSDYLGESNPVSILVNQLPNAQITQAPTSVCLNEEANFQAEFAGVGATYFWNFGAGANPQTSTERTPYGITYNVGGTKTITLTVEKLGCSTTIEYTLEVTNCLNLFEFTAFTTEETPNGTEVMLDWTTRYEINGSTFFLQHSKNGDDFLTFEGRPAKGSAQQVNTYAGVHAEPYYGVNYYRIKYVDATGKVVYSPVRVVVFDNGVSDIRVFPNPVKDFTYVEILTDLNADATIEVVDMTGRLLQTQVVADGFRTYRVDLSAYPAGTYLIWVRYNKWRKAVERVVKVTE